MVELEVIELISIIAIIFVLALILTAISYKSVEFFLLWLIVIATFFIYAGLLDSWVIILLIFIGVSIIFISFYNNKKGGM